MKNFLMISSIAWISLHSFLGASAYASRGAGIEGCKDALSTSLPVIEADRDLPPFPPMIRSDKHRTSCEMCGNVARGYFYNLTDKFDMRLSGDVYIYFYSDESKLKVSRSKFVDAKVGAKTAQSLFETPVPQTVSHCRFYVDEEVISYKILP